MLKFELRKLATIAMAVAVIGMMAACSGSSSSTDDALSHPGNNYLGSMRFDVNPQAESVDITPVGSPFTSNKVVGNGSGVIPNITISTRAQTGNACFIPNTQNNTSWAKITGVSCTAAHEGTNGTLAYLNAGSTMSWRAPGDAAAGATVVVANGGTYRLASATLTEALTVYVIQKRTANASDTNLNVQRYVKFVPGTGTMDFNARVKWLDPNRELYNVRIGPNSSTNLNVRTSNSSKCNGVWSGCIGTNDPAITYVADASTDGPVTFRACNQSGGACTTNYLNVIHAGCGSIMAHWTLTDAAATPYNFWADLYGDPHVTQPLESDTFYDPLTSSVYLRTFKMGTGSADPPEGAAATTMGPGEWFYVHFYVDSSGNNSPWTFDPTLPPVGQGDKHSEDVGNIAAWAGGTNNGANYWTVIQVEYSVKWDPAIIEISASNVNDGPGVVASKFTTAKGTVLMRTYDSLQGGTAAADGYDITAPVGTLASNKMGILFSQTQLFAAAMGFLPDPCGLMPGNNCNGADGFANIDLNIGRIPLRVRSTAVAGQGSTLHIAYDTATNITYGITNGLPYGAGNWTSDAEGPRSTNWPSWCSNTPAQACRPGMGQYNSERAYVCVQ